MVGRNRRDLLRTDPYDKANFLVELGVNMLVSPITVRIIAAVKKNK